MLCFAEPHNVGLRSLRYSSTLHFLREIGKKQTKKTKLKNKKQNYKQIKCHSSHKAATAENKTKQNRLCTYKNDKARLAISNMRHLWKAWNEFLLWTLVAQDLSFALNSHVIFAFLMQICHPESA